MPNGIWSRMTVLSDYFVKAATGLRPPRKSVCTKVLPTVWSALLGPAVSHLRFRIEIQVLVLCQGRYCQWPGPVLLRGTECSDYIKS